MISDIFDAMNLSIVFIGVITIYCSIRLSIALNRISPSKWWYVCPALIIWGVVNRLLVFIFADSPNLYMLSAMNLPWWMGITIFVHEVRVAAEKLIKDCK